MRTAKRRLPHNCYELQARRTRPYGPTHESSSCSHIDVPCGHGDQTCDVAIFAQAEVVDYHCHLPLPVLNNVVFHNRRFEMVRLLLSSRKQLVLT